MYDTYILEKVYIHVTHRKGFNTQQKSEKLTQKTNCLQNFKIASSDTIKKKI